MVNNLLKRAVRDIAVYFPGKLLPALTGIVTVPIFARLFRPEEYGLLAVIGMFTAAGGIAVSNWLTSSVMRFLAYYRQQGQLNRFYSTLLCAFALSAVALTMIGIPLYFLVQGTVSPAAYRLLPLAGLIIPLGSLFAILQTIQRADQRAKLFVGFELFNVYAGLVVGLFLVVALGLGVKGILLGSVASSAAAVLGIGRWLLRHGMQIKVKCISVATLRDFAAYGLPGGLATIGTWILSLSDRYIVEYFRGTAEVGLYSMGYNVADKSINLVVQSLMLAVGPILINTWESEHRESTKALLGQVTRMTLLLVLPMVVGLSILARPVFRVLTTEAYLRGAVVLSWVSLGAFFYGLSLQAYTGLIIAKKMVVMARNYLLAGAVNVLLNIMLVPRFGFVAAAVNTAVAYGFLLVLNIFSAIKYVPWLFPWRTLRNALVAAGVMAVLLWALGKFTQPNVLTLLLSVLAGAGIYGGVLFITGELSLQERGALRRMAGRAWGRFTTKLLVFRLRKGR